MIRRPQHGHRVRVKPQSAAERVFGIAELLEHIILYLYTDQDNRLLTCVAYSKELFILERVNLSCARIIRGSSIIRALQNSQLTGLNGEQYAWSIERMTPHLTEGHFKFGPFRLESMESRIDALGIEVSLAAPLDIHQLRSAVGLRASTDSNKTESWRQIKMSRASICSTRITVRVDLQVPPEAFFNLGANPSYDETIHDSKGALTLGDMAEFLEAIAQRSTAEHIAWMMYKGWYSITHFRIRANHAEVEQILKSARMHVSLMQLELATGVPNFRQTLTLRKKYLWEKPATEWIQDQLERTRLQQQRAVFGEPLSTSLSHQNSAPHLPEHHRMALQSTDFLSSVRDTSRSGTSVTLRNRNRGKAVPKYCLDHPKWNQNASQPTTCTSAIRDEAMEDVIYH